MSPPVFAHRVGVTILVDFDDPYTRGILRDYGLTSLVTGIKALACTRPAIWQRANAECKTGVTAERGRFADAQGALCPIKSIIGRMTMAETKTELFHAAQFAQ